jgi:hypothetical protein
MAAPADQLAALIAALTDVRRQNTAHGTSVWPFNLFHSLNFCFLVAAIAFLSYDICITFGQEVRTT